MRPSRRPARLRACLPAVLGQREVGACRCGARSGSTRSRHVAPAAARPCAQQANPSENDAADVRARADRCCGGLPAAGRGRPCDRDGRQRQRPQPVRARWRSAPPAPPSASSSPSRSRRRPAGRSRRRRPAADLGARSPPRRLPSLWRRRSRSHARADGDRALVRPRRAALRPLPDASARRSRSGGALRDLRNAGAGELRSRRPRGPVSGPDGEPWRDHPRPDTSTAVELSLLLEWACTVYWRAAAIGSPRVLTPSSGRRWSPPPSSAATDPRSRSSARRRGMDERRDGRDRDGRPRARRPRPPGRGDPGGSGCDPGRGDPDHRRRVRRRRRADAGEARRADLRAPARSAPTRWGRC